MQLDEQRLRFRDAMASLSAAVKRCAPPQAKPAAAALPPRRYAR